MKRPLKIIISGMIAGDPWQGGATWAVLQYVLGLKQLGHEVLFIEPIDPKSLKPSGVALRDSRNAAYFDRVTKAFDFQGKAALLLSNTEQTFGMDYGELLKRAQSADLLINISGMLRDEKLLAASPVRVYLDLDPAFNQLWSEVQKINMRFEGHTHFITVGQNIGNPDCSVPNCGLTWRKTMPPVVLGRWPVVNKIEYDGLTTVANWRGYGSIEHEGRLYGQKAHSLRQFIALPKLTSEAFMLALAIHPNETRDLESLAANGWQLIDPAEVAQCPDNYQRFVQGSKAEFGITKSGYVISHSGWVSDRSVCYLASGRPVIAQETGFSRFLPTGLGLFAFQNMQDVVAAIEQLNRSYEKHCRYARSIAEEVFDSRKVLARFLDQVGF